MPPPPRALVALAAALAAVQAGCAAEAPAPEAGPAAGAPRGAWWVEPEAAEVAALRERLAALADAPACQDALVDRAVEAAHALFVTGEDPALRAALARGLDRRLGGGAYAACVAAPAAARARLAAARAARLSDAPRAAEEARAAAGDLDAAGAGLLALEARALADAADGGREALLLSSTALRGQAYAGLRLALLALRAGGDAAATVEAAARLGDLATLERLAALAELGVVDASRARAWEWRAAAARLALGRGQGPRALTHALAAQEARAADPQADPAARLRDRLLVARATLAAGRAEPALDQALAVADAADALPEAGPGEAPAALAGAARALAGDALLATGRAEPALEAYARAQAAFARAGDAAGVYRQGLNRAAAALRAGAGPVARAALDDLADAPDVELACRRAILEQLARVLGGASPGAAAAREVEGALVQAKAAGALDVVEAHRDLPGRLRAGPGAPRPPGR